MASKATVASCLLRGGPGARLRWYRAPKAGENKSRLDGRLSRDMRGTRPVGCRWRIGSKRRELGLRHGRLYQVERHVAAWEDARKMLKPVVSDAGDDIVEGGARSELEQHGNMVGHDN